MRFEDLKFEGVRPGAHPGFRASHSFDFGWLFCGICFPGVSCGGDRGRYELAVLGRDGELHYGNPVTQDSVHGYLKPEDVTWLLRQVAKFDEEGE